MGARSLESPNNSTNHHHLNSTNTKQRHCPTPQCPHSHHLPCQTSISTAAPTPAFHLHMAIFPSCNQCSSSSTSMQRNFITSSSYFSIIFWACRGCNPAADLGLLLILAGDVETNPGPDDTNKCYICSYPIKKNQKPLACSFHGCTNKSHKQFKCSDMKPGTDPTEWVCNQHSDDDILLESVRQIELSSGTKPSCLCDSCGSVLNLQLLRGWLPKQEPFHMQRYLKIQSDRCVEVQGSPL